MVVIGTRPEAIKVAPLIIAMRQIEVPVKLCITGQHQDLVTDVLDFFSIAIDHKIRASCFDRDLGYHCAELIEKTSTLLKIIKPSALVVHGDTISAYSAAVAGFLNQIDVLHVEAGLRSHDLKVPFPEEFCRRQIDTMSTMHFCPTEQNRTNLFNEGIPTRSIHVTGNTGIDALLLTLKSKPTPKLRSFVDGNSKKKILLVTAHRRENWGDNLSRICAAVNQLVKLEPLHVVWMLHPNPAIEELVRANLSESPKLSIFKPLSYPEMCYLMNACWAVLTDSGGLQEEAPSLNKPVLVMRAVTERQEAVDVGAVKLVGNKTDQIVQSVRFLLDEASVYASMARAKNPYGDGMAAVRIADLIKAKYFENE